MELERESREKDRRERTRRREWALWDQSVEWEDLTHVVIWAECDGRQSDAAEPCPAPKDKLAVGALRFSRLDPSRWEVEVYVPAEEPAAAAQETLPMSDLDLGGAMLPRVSTYRIEPELAGVLSPSAHPNVESLLDD